jgi:hypothetical protein
MTKRCTNLFVPTFDDHIAKFSLGNRDEHLWENHKIYDFCRADYMALARTFEDAYEIVGDKVKILVIKRHGLETPLNNLRSVDVKYMDYGQYWSVVLEIEGMREKGQVDLKYSSQAAAETVKKALETFLVSA